MLGIAFVLVQWLGYPVLFIWSVNTLFGGVIPWSFKTYLASVLLLWIVRFYSGRSILPWYYDFLSPFHGHHESDEDGWDDEEDLPPPPPRKRGKRLKRIK